MTQVQGMNAVADLQFLRGMHNGLIAIGVEAVVKAGRSSDAAGADDLARHRIFEHEEIALLAGNIDLVGKRVARIGDLVDESITIRRQRGDADGALGRDRFDLRQVSQLGRTENKHDWPRLPWPRQPQLR